MQSFFQSAAKLYANVVDRERVAIYGEGAQLRLLVLDTANGNALTVRQVLETGWMAWTVEAGANDADTEFWFAELHAASGAEIETVKRTVAVEIISQGRGQRYKVLQNYKPMETGLVWQIKLNPTGETVEI